MTINSLTSGGATAVTHASRVAGTSSTSSAQQAGRMPPPPDEGGGLLGAIADALKSIGVDGTGDASASTASPQAGDADAAQALGGFLENLMAALHAQGGDDGASPAYGQPPQGGPGQLSADLQGLIAALGDEATGTTTADGVDTADSSVTALQGAFKNLLTSLGGDAADADAKLSGFLQTLSSRLPTAGSAGNLVDTTA